MPEKMPPQNKNIADENLAKLIELFPNIVTETVDKDGNVIHAIDVDAMQEEINMAVVSGDQQRYEFTWPNKRDAKRKANEPIDLALRPCVDESVDWADTQNIYIKGDNLDALKILRETYRGKVKMIYIDPPYNTGSDFVYRDNFSMSAENYREVSGQYDEDGGRLFQNTESNGRFHTDWLNMIYPRLRVAKSFLSDDGVIFIHIDDSEQGNLKKACDEIFGANNFIAQVIWERAFSPVNLKKHFSESHDYILCYAKNKSLALCHGIRRTQESIDRYTNPDNDPRGPWTSGDLSVGPRVEDKVYAITTPSGRKVLPPSGYCWRLDKKTFNAYVADNRIWFGEDGNNVPRIKRFLSEVKEGITPMTIWKYADVGHQQKASQDLKELFDDKAYFTYPKPVELINRCLELYSDNDSVVMDFFSGSATTAHAVMQLNAEDGGKRKFIMVQLPEVCSDDSEAARAGYKTICDIGMERIRRAGKKIREERPDAKDLDTGFRVFKVDSTNMNDVERSPDELVDFVVKKNDPNAQEALFKGLTDNIKSDRTSMDLLIQTMLTYNIELSEKIEERIIDGKHVFIVDPEINRLVACFDKDMTEQTIIEIAKMRPCPQDLVTRDSSMRDNTTALNCQQRLDEYSGGREIKWRVI